MLSIMKPLKTASHLSLFAATNAALAAAVLSLDLAISSLIAQAIMAKMPFENSSGVMPADLKLAAAFGHLDEMAAAQASGVMLGSFPMALNSAFAASSPLKLLMALSILSSRSLVRGMAPAALI